MQVQAHSVITVNRILIYCVFLNVFVCAAADADLSKGADYSKHGARAYNGILGRRGVQGQSLPENESFLSIFSYGSKVRI